MQALKRARITVGAGFYERNGVLRHRGATAMRDFTAKRALRNVTATPPMTSAATCLYWQINRFHPRPSLLPLMAMLATGAP